MKYKLFVYYLWLWMLYACILCTITILFASVIQYIVLGTYFEIVNDARFCRFLQILAISCAVIPINEVVSLSKIRGAKV